jgi:hypothetical protein
VFRESALCWVDLDRRTFRSTETLGELPDLLFNLKNSVPQLIMIGPIDVVKQAAESANLLPEMDDPAFANFAHRAVMCLYLRSLVPLKSSQLGFLP